MDDIFRRAETRTKRRMLAGASVVACALLFMGVGIGYVWGSARETTMIAPVPVSANVLTVAPPAKPVFDFTTTATWPTAPLEAQVVRLHPGNDSSDEEA